MIRIANLLGFEIPITMKDEIPKVFLIMALSFLLPFH